MVLKWVLISAMVIPIIVALVLLNLNNNAPERIDIQLIREEMHIIDFRITENISTKKRDLLFIDNSSILFNSDNNLSEHTISNDDLKRLRDFITGAGVLLIDREEFIPEQLEGQFVRYTLIINIDNHSKRFQWVESDDEFEPSIAPPLIIKLKDIIYCIAKKGELYGIECS